MEDAIPLIGHFRSPSIVENEISGLSTSLVANLTHLRSLILDGVSFDDDFDRYFSQFMSNHVEVLELSNTGGPIGLRPAMLTLMKQLRNSVHPDSPYRHFICCVESSVPVPNQSNTSACAAMI
jgi:hypothetical protein